MIFDIYIYYIGVQAGVHVHTVGDSCCNPFSFAPTLLPQLLQLRQPTAWIGGFWAPYVFRLKYGFNPVGIKYVLLTAPTILYTCWI